jgi:hypothetical protein
MAHAIPVSELAQQYFPRVNNADDAVTQLKRWVKRSEGLTARLNELELKPRQQVLTPLQHQAFLDFLGDP